MGLALQPRKKCHRALSDIGEYRPSIGLIGIDRSPESVGEGQADFGEFTKMWGCGGVGITQVLQFFFRNLSCHVIFFMTKLMAPGTD